MLEVAGKGAESLGLGIEGTKVVKRAAQYLGRKLTGDNSGNTEDASANDDAGSGGNTNTSTGDQAGDRAGADDAGTGDAEGFAEPEGGGFIDDDALGTEGGTGEPAGTLSDRAQTGDLPEGFEPPNPLSDPAPGSLEGGTGGEGSLPGAGAGGEGTDAGASIGGRAGTALQASQGTDAPAEGPTLEGAPDSVVEATAGGTEAGTGATLADVAGGVSDAAGAVAGAVAPVLDALGPLGLLAGLGISLYEAFHKSPDPPKPPQNAAVNRMKTAMVLPTYDNVQDTPAASSAF